MYLLEKNGKRMLGENHVVGHVFELKQIALDIFLKCSAVAKGFDFCKGARLYGRMLVEWKEASETLDADQKKKNMAI